MALPFDVCIRGAGIVGRTLALLLARERLRVGLVQAPAMEAQAADVRAYALNAASRSVLESVRAWPQPIHATAVSAMQVWGDNGGQVSFSAREQGAEALAWIVDVPALEAQLMEAVRFQPHIELLQTPQPAALTVVCEGRASATRAEFGVEFQLTPYAQQGIAVRVEAQRPHDQVARQWFRDGEILAFLPLSTPSGNSVAIVWSVHQGHAADLMALAPGEFEERLEAASAHLLGKLSLASQRAAWPLQLARADRWSGDGWALAGDAAHNVHPLAGQGLNLGLGDAAELARVLAARAYWRGVGDARLLRQYERARKAEVALMGRSSDSLQQLFALPGAGLQTLRNWGMKGFERSGPLKQWVARRAMGLN